MSKFWPMSRAAHPRVLSASALHVEVQRGRIERLLHVDIDRARDLFDPVGELQARASNSPANRCPRSARRSARVGRNSGSG